jgi:hypothetical protein
MDMYTIKRLVGCQAAFAGKLGSHKGSVYIREKQAGCQAAFASKSDRRTAAPTGFS